MAVVVITGCSSGFGLASAIGFARDGNRVYATVRNLSKAPIVQSAATEANVSLFVRELDVTSDRSVQQATAEILDAEGGIDVLVNNAGVARSGPVELLPDALVRETFETNFFGPLRMIRAVLPAMRGRRSGAIINISSVSGRLPGKPIAWAYDASKHALSALSDGLAIELEQFGIRVRVIEPGFFATSMLGNSVVVSDPESPYRQLEDAALDYFTERVASAPDPQQVVAAIMRAAGDPGPSAVHTLVGDDAETLVSTYQSIGEEEWASRLRNLLRT